MMTKSIKSKSTACPCGCADCTCGTGVPCTCGCPDCICCGTATTNRLPLIGDDAPAFKADSTCGMINFPADYKGKWVILFSHPSDFTPVCTTEFIAFALMADEFRQLNTELLGIAVDSVNSHVAWLGSIYNDITFKGKKNIEVTFPLVADISMDVSKKYGMIHPNMSTTKAVRAVFIIDPSAKVRAVLYYPASAGRNFAEIKRLLVALQTGDAFNVATPADWEMGDDIIVPAPTTCKGAKAAAKDKTSGMTVCSWYLRFKKLAKADIVRKLMKK